VVFLRRHKKDMTPIPPVDHKPSVPVLVGVQRVVMPPWMYQPPKEDFIPECQRRCTCCTGEVSEPRPAQCEARTMIESDGTCGCGCLLRKKEWCSSRICWWRPGHVGCWKPFGRSARACELQLRDSGLGPR
jgi:hypothetical protein